MKQKSMMWIRQLASQTLLIALLFWTADITAAPKPIDKAQTTKTKKKTIDKSAIQELDFSQIKKFMTTYCVDCHGPKKQKADHRFDDLTDDFTDARTAERWQEALDLINLGEMPPEDDPQPSFDMKRNVIHWMTQGLAKAREHAASSSTGTALRRMTNHEYNNTIRDLFGINIQQFNPSEGFPKEAAEHGFENTAKDLVTSDYLLNKYLEAADRILDKAIVDPNKRPQTQKYNFSVKQLSDPRDVYIFKNGYKGSKPFMDIMSNVPPASRVTPRKFYQGVPHDGQYRIRFKAQIVYRKGNDPKFLQLLGASSQHGRVSAPSPMDKQLALFEMKDEIETFEVETWLDQGIAPILYFMNGGGGGQPVLRRLGAEEDGLRSAVFFPVDKIRKNMAYYVQELHKGERVRLFNFEVEGPILTSWPPKSHRVIYGHDRRIEGDFTKVKSRLWGFARLAYRRAPEKGELNTILSLVKSKMDAGMPYAQAVRLGVKAILTSPGFIYIKQNDGELDDFALASRLSYFLWNTGPDQTLLELASKKELKANLREQAERMLNDQNAWSFITNFSEQWLKTNKLGEMPPDMRKFRTYYEDNLEDLMKQETYHYFQHVLRKNLPISHFIDSQYTFLNSRLAKLYEIPGIEGDKLRYVKLPANSVRGGVITHASVLTATSNGVDTSPVVRGVWMLESLLGTPPTPPPPDVEPLDPDIRGAKTIREQLAKHREIETCRDCHQKIDPYGFILESFDPIGRHRTHYLGKLKKRRYLKGPRIDTADTLPDGKHVKNIQALKKHLLKKQHKVAYGLTEHLLTYALARPVTFRKSRH